MTPEQFDQDHPAAAAQARGGYSYREPDYIGAGKLTENGTPIPGTEYEVFSTPLMEIQSSVMPLSIVFDVCAYLDRDHSEVEMFEMIRKLRAAVE